MADRKKYMRDLMRSKRANKKANRPANKKAESVSKSANIANKKAVSTSKTVSSVSTIEWHPEVDQSGFSGRGVPTNGFVLVSLGMVPEGSPECGVVTVKDWISRLKETCSHQLDGWSCKRCLT